MQIHISRIRHNYDYVTSVAANQWHLIGWDSREIWRDEMRKLKKFADDYVIDLEDRCMPFAELLPSTRNSQSMLMKHFIEFHRTILARSSHDPASLPIFR